MKKKVGYSAFNLFEFKCALVHVFLLIDFLNTNTKTTSYINNSKADKQTEKHVLYVV